jgi:ABC-type nitrate/sulfonate/bicarbonate transport system permease component
MSLKTAERPPTATESIATPVLSEPRRFRPWKSPAFVRTLILIGVLIIWDLASRLGFVDDYFISSPAGVVSGAVYLAQDASVVGAFGVTLRAVAQAFLIGATLGLVLGLAIGSSRLLRDAYLGPILFVLTIPKPVFVPIFLLIFGSANTATAFGAFEAAAYMTANVVGGVGLVQQQHRTVARAFGAKPWYRFTDVIAPAAAPGIFAGVWYALKHALLGVVIVELFISVGGIGRSLRHYTDLLETDRVIAIILTVSLLAILVGTAWARLEARLTRWRPDDRIATAATK